MSRRTIIKLAVAAFVTGALVACGARDERKAMAAPAGSTLEITDITPNLGAPLTVGQDVKLRVSVAYALTSDSGTLGLVVQDAENKPLAQVVNVVLKGGGTEKFEASFKVPDTPAVHVFAALASQGQSATSTVANRSFKVQSR
jgi:hypothetical protein